MKMFEIVDTEFDCVLSDGPFRIRSDARLLCSKYNNVTGRRYAIRSYFTDTLGI